MKNCPHCKQPIQEAAVKCRFCGGLVGLPPAGTAIRLPETSGKAVASLALGAAWIWWIGSALALIFGYQSRGEIARSNGELTGRGLATAGIVLGWVGIVTLVGTVALVVIAVVTGAKLFS